MNNEGDTESTFSRRSVLQTMETIAAGSVLGSVATGTVGAKPDCALPESSGSYTEDPYLAQDETTDWVSSQYRKSYYEIVNRGIELRSSATVLDSWYGNGRWKHDILLGGHVATQESDDGGDTWYFETNLDKQEVVVENKNQSTAAMLTSEHSTWIGAAPSPGSGSNYDYGEVAYTVLKAAIGKTNPHLGLAITATDALLALEGDNESTEELDGKETYTWGYGCCSYPCEGTHFIKVRMECLSGYSSAEVDLTNTAANMSPSLTASVGWNVYVSSDTYQNISGASSTSSTETTANDSPGPGTSEYVNYLERNDAFVKVPYDEIRDPTKREQANGQPIYRAVDPEVSIQRV